MAGDAKHKHLGLRIRAAREAMSPAMTQADLGELLGVDGNNVSRWERGLVRPPSKKRKRLGDVLKKPESYFVEEPLSGAKANGTVREEQLPQLRNLRAFMQTTHWDEASATERAAVLDEANRLGGDLDIDEWKTVLKVAKKKLAHGLSAATTTDALGRTVGEEDVVHDPDDDL